MGTNKKDYNQVYYLRTKATRQQYNKSHRGDRVAQQRRVYERDREIVSQAYGNCCSCPGCMEDIPKMLTLDHVENDGAEHRRIETWRVQGRNLYRWIVQNNFPPTFRLLCWNCNCGRAKNNGVCPHHTFTSTDKLLRFQPRVFTNQLHL